MGDKEIDYKYKVRQSAPPRTILFGLSLPTVLHGNHKKRKCYKKGTEARDRTHYGALA